MVPEESSDESDGGTKRPVLLSPFVGTKRAVGMVATTVTRREAREEVIG